MLRLFSYPPEALNHSNLPIWDLSRVSFQPLQRVDRIQKNYNGARVAGKTQNHGIRFRDEVLLEGQVAWCGDDGQEIARIRISSGECSNLEILTQEIFFRQGGSTRSIPKS